MKRIIMVLIGILGIMSVQAQEKMYLDADRQITNKGNAVYYRIAKQYKVKEDETTGKKHYMIMEYFQSGRIGMVGSFLTEKAMIKDGPFVFYHSNGREKEKGIFSKDKRIGQWKFWGENGQLQEEREYPKNQDTALDQEYLLLNVYNSEGQQLVKQGKGDCKQYHSNGQLMAEGKVINGKKEGIWHGYYPNGKAHYMENFKDGKLIKGISYDTRGKKFEYQKFYIAPTAKKGMDDFYAYVGRKMKYPKSAASKKIEGEVLIQFALDKKGAVKDAKVLKGIGGGCNEEALSLVANGPNWKAAVERGQRKDEKVIVPITFNLKSL